MGMAQVNSAWSSHLDNHHDDDWRYHLSRRDRATGRRVAGRVQRTRVARRPGRSVDHAASGLGAWLAAVSAYAALRRSRIEHPKPGFLRCLLPLCPFCFQDRRQSLAGRRTHGTTARRLLLC